MVLPCLNHSGARAPPLESWAPVSKGGAKGHMDLFEIMYQMVRQQYSDLETLGSESSLAVDNKILYFIDKERETCQKISHNHPPGPGASLRPK